MSVETASQTLADGLRDRRRADAGCDVSWQSGQSIVELFLMGAGSLRGGLDGCPVGREQLFEVLALNRDRVWCVADDER